MKAPPTDKQILFVRVPLAALESIEQNLEQGPSASAKLVLVALYRVAFKEKSWTFKKSVAHLASLASVGERTVIRRLKDLVQLHLVEVSHNQIPDTRANDFCTYTLPSLSQKVVPLSQKVVSRNEAHAVTASMKENKSTRNALTEDERELLEATR